MICIIVFGIAIAYTIKLYCGYTLSMLSLKGIYMITGLFGILLVLFYEIYGKKFSQTIGVVLLLTMVISYTSIWWIVGFDQVNYGSASKTGIDKKSVFLWGDDFDGSELPKSSNEFYRISDNNIEKPRVNNERPENLNLLKHRNGLSSYNSLINKDIMQWFRSNHNVYNFYMTPSYYNGMDNRLFLENFWGVKYIINSNKQPPHGYTVKTNSKGQTYYENKNCLGIDLWYDRVMRKQEYQKLDIAEKDAAILQNAVLEDEDVPDDIEKAKLDKITEKIDLDINKAELTDCYINNGNLIVKKTEGKTLNDSNFGKITFNIPKHDSDGEHLFNINLRCESAYSGDWAFKLAVNNHIYTNKAKDNYAYNYPIDEYTFRIDGDDDKLIIKLTPGTYKINNMNLYFNSYSKLSTWTNDLNKYEINDLKINHNNIKGRIHNDDKGILALNIPYSEGWTCQVDGDEVEILKVDGAIIGIKLNPGMHKIELHYFPPLLKLGATITLITILGMILSVYYTYIVKKNRKKVEFQHGK